MNKKFKEYTTSTAFQLNLSKNMTDFLLYRYAAKKQGRNRYYQLRLSNSVTTKKSLRKRGLIKDCYTLNKKSDKFMRDSCEITEEGKKVCELLLMAGFKEPVIVDMPNMDELLSDVL